MFKLSLVRYLILQTIIQEEPQNLVKVLKRNLILKTKLPVKIRDAHKTERNNSTSILAFDYENKEKISNLCVQCCEENHLTYC